ncbi:MAG TPA: hypothetical protein VKJ00_03520 [Thermoanaerobaculia bacterium]|nr:hypothetical protein [Thermoanaerobaculia bacterium]
MNRVWPRQVAHSLVVLTLSMSLADFIEVQALSSDDLRKRFRLHPSCDPAVTASMTDPAASSLMVAIECRAKTPSSTTSEDSSTTESP